MANQRICDRCGKPIDNPDYIPWLIMPYKPGDDSRYKFEHMTRDLCADCESSLTDWMLNIDSEKRREIESKIIELVDQGVFDRINVISAEEVKKILKLSSSGSGTDA